MASKKGNLPGRQRLSRTFMLRTLRSAGFLDKYGVFGTLSQQRLLKFYDTFLRAFDYALFSRKVISPGLSQKITDEEWSRPVSTTFSFEGRRWQAYFYHDGCVAWVKIIDFD